MASHVHILGISGSVRKGSVNTALLRETQLLLPPDTTMAIADISGIPLYDEDVRQAGMPEAVERFKAEIAAADALLFAVPEYNYSITGVLKNAIDWASRPPDSSPFVHKAASMLGSGGRFGTVRAQMHLRMILSALHVFVLPKPELMLQFGHRMFDAEGRLTDDETREALRAQAEALVNWTRRLRGE